MHVVLNALLECRVSKRLDLKWRNGSKNKNRQYLYLYELVSVYYMVLATTVVHVAVGLGAVGLGCKLGCSFRLTRVLASTLTANHT